MIISLPNRTVLLQISLDKKTPTVMIRLYVVKTESRIKFINKKIEEVLLTWNGQKMTKQGIDFQKVTFQNSVSSMLTFQEQMERMVSTFLEQSTGQNSIKFAISRSN